MYVRAWGGGLKALADISAKNISFILDDSPYQAPIVLFGPHLTRNQTQHTFSVLCSLLSERALIKISTLLDMSPKL